jgi:5'-AMP-activated protein kinase, regulatory beta subunit
VRPGTHRFHFVVDGEWRISNEFATATDSEGNLLNYLEAAEYDNHDFEPYSRSESIHECSSGFMTLLMSGPPEPVVQKDVWTRTIPSYVSRISDSPSYNGRYSHRSSYPEDEIMPPALPRQLEKPFLNQNHIQKDDQSVLPNPAHVPPLIHMKLTTGCAESLGSSE